MKFLLLIAILALSDPIITKPLYNTLHSYVSPINKLNFEK